MLYWAYDQHNNKKSEPFARKIVSLLGDVSGEFLGIIGYEALALAHEMLGDGERVIELRRTQIDKMRAYIKAHPGEGAMYTHEDLADRYDLLAALYMDRGGWKDFDVAIRLLRTSKRLAATHGHKFDGEELLADAVRLKEVVKKQQVP